MKPQRAYAFAILVAAPLMVAAGVARAGISEPDQSAISTRYVGKVLLFHNCYRMISKLEVMEDGTLKGRVQPGYWAMDGAFQVKSVSFGKERVSFKGPKLWADIKKDGGLHYFPVSTALKGAVGYPEDLEVVIHTKLEGETPAQFTERVDGLFFNDQESKLEGAPAPIARYIRNEPVQVDTEFKGTPPKPISTPQPYPSREASLVKQTGTENFVVLVDERGQGSIDGFTDILQYGLEEAAIEAVKKWKFEPATLDGKALPMRLAMSIKFQGEAK